MVVQNLFPQSHSCRLRSRTLDLPLDRQGMVTVTGEAGVGKSRLLHELDVWADLLPEPFYYFRGRANHETQNLPYGLIRDLISFRLQILDSDPAAIVRGKLEEGLAEAVGPEEASQKSAHVIGHLLGFALGASGDLVAIPEDPEQFHKEALSSLAAYVRGLARQAPVLILLEDLHWADDSSLDALNYLAQALAAEPVMVVSTARPHWGEGQPFHARLVLAPLSRWDSRRLVAEIRVPPTLIEVLQARVDRLPPEERTVLQQASVVRRLFWDQAVARIHASEDQLRAAFA